MSEQAGSEQLYIFLFRSRNSNADMMLFRREQDIPTVFINTRIQLLSYREEKQDEKAMLPTLEKLLGWKQRNIRLNIFIFPASIGR